MPYITANKNSVPNDPRSPFVTSGLRIGTPAVTTRGFGVEACEQVAGWLCDVLDALENGDSDKVGHHVREQVVALCRRFPVYRSVWSGHCLIGSSSCNGCAWSITYCAVRSKRRGGR